MSKAPESWMPCIMYILIRKKKSPSDRPWPILISEIFNYISRYFLVWSRARSHLDPPWRTKKYWNMLDKTTFHALLSNDEFFFCPQNFSDYQFLNIHVRNLLKSKHKIFFFFKYELFSKQNKFWKKRNAAKRGQPVSRKRHNALKYEKKCKKKV